MYYIKEHYTDTLEVKQSKFIAHLVPYTDYESTLNKLQQEHPKARHFVTAYRYLNEYGQIVIQHFSRNILPDSINELILDKVKKYGNSSISIYKNISKFD